METEISIGIIGCLWAGFSSAGVMFDYTSSWPRRVFYTPGVFVFGWAAIKLIGILLKLKGLQ